MLLQSGLTFSASEQLNGQRNDHMTPSSADSFVNKTIGGHGGPAATNTAAQPTAAPNDVSRYVDMVQDSLKEGWSVHAAKDGRLYYCK